MKAYNKLSDRWGTPQYFAPEMLRKAYGPQVGLPVSPAKVGSFSLELRNHRLQLQSPSFVSERSYSSSREPFAEGISPCVHLKQFLIFLIRSVSHLFRLNDMVLRTHRWICGRWVSCFSSSSLVGYPSMLPQMLTCLGDFRRSPHS